MKTKQTALQNSFAKAKEIIDQHASRALSSTLSSICANALNESLSYQERVVESLCLHYSDDSRPLFDSNTHPMTVLNFAFWLSSLIDGVQAAKKKEKEALFPLAMAA